MKAITLIPANDRQPKGKFVNLSAIRNALPYLEGIQINDVIEYVGNSSSIDKDMEEYELIQHLCYHFKPLKNEHPY